MNPTAQVRIAAKALALAVAAALGLAGCSLTASITTDRAYSPSDGVGVELSGVKGQNLLIVSAGEGQPAVLLGSLTNSRHERVGVTISAGTDSQGVVLPSNGSVRLLVGDDSQTLVTTATAAPGALMPIGIKVTGGERVTLQVPVLDGTLPEYAAVLAALDTELETEVAA